jgi:hypothetical protein
MHSQPYLTNFPVKHYYIQYSLAATNLNTAIFTKFPMYHWEDNVNIGRKMLREFS